MLRAIPSQVEGWRAAAARRDDRPAGGRRPDPASPRAADGDPGPRLPVARDGMRRTKAGRGRRARRPWARRDGTSRSAEARTWPTSSPAEPQPGAPAIRQEDRPGARKIFLDAVLEVRPNYGRLGLD
jgi:hypothetical protein